MSKSTTDVVDVKNVRPAIKTPYNAHLFPKYQEDSPGISKTIPDQTLGLRQLLTRFARGLPIEGEKFPMYHGDDTPPDLKRMDFAEIQEYQEKLTEDIRRMQSELSAQEHARTYEENQKQLREQFKKWKDEEEKANQPKLKEPKAGS